MEEGAVNAIVAVVSPAVAVPIVGASGTVSVTVPPELLELLSSPPHPDRRMENVAAAARPPITLVARFCILFSRYNARTGANSGLWKQYGGAGLSH